MRKLGIFLILIGLIGVAGSLFLNPPLECQLLRLTERAGTSASPKRYCARPTAELEDMWQQLDEHRKQLEPQVKSLEKQFENQMRELTRDQRVQRDDVMIEEPPRLKRLRLELINTVVEQDDIRAALRVHKLRFPLLMGGVAFLGLLLLLVGSIRGRSGGVPARFSRAVTETETETWLDPARAEGAIAMLIEDRQKAIAELWALRPTHCSYCNEALGVEPTGRIEFVTVLKEAPRDVTNPKRIVLGKGFRIVPPDAIPCPSCGHNNRI
ncbi:MAG: hypothetical protein D6761_05785 [Candidatus Dadabacteria bacterium]|nr:MAG: hypothetical protein D6761_05785 [Candidatus Dadabacteria bacterium]